MTAYDDISFFSSSGSVQAEVQLEVASPNVSVVYQVVSSMDNVGNFSIDRNATKIRSEQGNVVTKYLTVYVLVCYVL